MSLAQPNRSGSKVKRPLGVRRGDIWFFFLKIVPGDLTYMYERLDRESQKSKIHQLPQLDDIWLNQIGQGQRSRDLLV
jgi:hypothetical protein